MDLSRRDVQPSLSGMLTAMTFWQDALSASHALAIIYSLIWLKGYGRK